MAGTVSLISLMCASVPGAAIAADMSTPAVDYVHDWSGWFFGIKGGYATGDAQLVGLGGSSGDYTIDGGVIGTMSGYNFQSGNIVYGIDMDSAFGNLEGTTSPANICASCTTEINWLSTFRGRVGVAMDNVLPFVTAGVAYGEVEVNIPAALNPGGGNRDDIFVGYVVGAGIDWAFNDEWTARLDYQYIDLGDENLNFPGGVVNASVDNLHIIRVGIATDISRFYRRR